MDRKVSLGFWQPGREAWHVGPLMRMAKDGEIPKAVATLGISAQAEVVVRAQAAVTHGIGARPRIGINRKPI